MNSIKILDVTLRDGGCVNNFNFGSKYIEKILTAQEQSNVEYIELGYIDEKKGSETERTQYISEKVISNTVLKQKKPGVTYLAMIDYGKFDVNNLSLKTEGSIDGIRLAFHKENINNIVEIGKKILEKGYLLFIQPMITLRYTDTELLQLIDLVNKELSDASGFYIVDSFGEMRINDVNRMLNIVDNNLVSTMTLGFHSHNNLQMSYANAIAMLQFPTNRNIIIDSSIMGMGKGAGNLNTELLMEHLNLFYGKNYDISPLLEVIDKVINQLHSEFYWGYAPEYYLSSINHCTPSYSSHFYNRHMLPIDQVGELLRRIDDKKKISFDKEYAEKLYRQYNDEKSIDDKKTVEELIEIFKGKRILLIAPGKSILDAKKEISKIANTNDVITIGLNTDLEINDFIITTRKDVYDRLINKGKNIIVCSNISKGGRGSVRVLNYKNWIEIDEGTHDSSSVIAFNLLEACGVKDILLAGFDGFDVNINDNYYDSNMRYPVNIEEANKRNVYYKSLINRKIKKGIKISFITPSKYE